MHYKRIIGIVIVLILAGVSFGSKAFALTSKSEVVTEGKGSH